MQRQSLRRTVTFLMLLTLVSVTLLSMQVTSAQDGGTERRLGVGQAVTGTLSTDNFAESYVFDASEGNTATLTATTSAEDLSLALILTDPSGNIIASDGDLASPTVATLSNVSLPSNGTYVVTVLRGTGADGSAEGEYTLALTGTITPPPATGGVTDSNSGTTGGGREVFVQLDNGTVEFELSWNAAVDMNLEVRDPVGGAIYWENSSVLSGGQHSGNTNGVCDEATADSPAETVNWSAQSVPVGSYEVLIYYQNGCSVGGPQNFTLSVAVNGEDAETVEGRINPGQVYLARMELALDKSWTVFDGGVNAGLDNTQVADAQPLTIGQEVTGSITNQNVGDSYTFEAVSGETITITHNATSGSLDPLLILLNESGQQVASNDDGIEGTTNSFISVSIPSDGTYTVIATRYGQTIGGTQGNYSLTVARPATTVTDNGTTVTTTPSASGELPDGSIEVALRWGTEADLQLLVRDPNGAAVFDDATTITSGGILDQVGNQNCVSAGGNPVSYIYWPSARTPQPGTYEIEVWFQSECEDTRLAPFTLTVNVGGNEILNTTQTPTLGGRYVVAFTIDANGSATAGEGGFALMNDVTSGIDIASNVGAARAITYDEIVQGTITQEQKFAIYSFDARAGDRISVSMQATGGNLDTAVYVVGPGPSYIQLAFNDDIEVGVNTNSRISSVQLDQDGTYYVVATHYGLRYGGTQGNYTLILTLLP